LNRSAVAPVFLLLLLISGCVSIRHEEGPRQEPVISIFNAGEGGISARPVDLTVSPGQGVVFSNHSDYDISLNLDFGNGETESIGIIPPLSSNRVDLEKPGEVRYILHFSSARNFGEISGKLTIEEGQREKEQSPDRAPAPSPSSEPVII
jgi:hypothetical protein